MFPAGSPEPGDERASSREDAPVVLVESVVALEPHATLRESVDSLVDVLDREVEDRVVRRRVVRPGVDERVSPAREVQRQQAVCSEVLTSSAWP
jgi:hypothetical protein